MSDSLRAVALRCAEISERVGKDGRNIVGIAIRAYAFTLPDTTERELVLEEVLAILAIEDIEHDPDDLYTGRFHRLNRIRALKFRPAQKEEKA